MLPPSLRTATVLAASFAFTALAGDSKPPSECTGHQHAAAPAGDAKPAAATPGDARSGVLARGEKLKGLPAVKLAALVATPDQYAGKAVRLEGTVRRACAKMGCWMELAESAAPSAAGVRVVMKGHAFFVPTDSAGSRATVEGAVSVETLDAEKAHHLESEGAAVSRGKDGKAREVQVEATGVELVRS